MVGDFPALSDAVARTVAWFERHMPAERIAAPGSPTVTQGER